MTQQLNKHDSYSGGSWLKSRPQLPSDLDCHAFLFHSKYFMHGIESFDVLHRNILCTVKNNLLYDRELRICGSGTRGMD